MLPPIHVKPLLFLFWCRHHAAAVGLLLKLLDCHCHELLHTFYLKFSTLSLKLHRSSRLAIFTQPHQLADTIVYNSLYIFRKAFWDLSLGYGRIKLQYVCIRMVTLLDGRLYLRTFNMLCIIINVNDHGVFIINKTKHQCFFNYRRLFKDLRFYKVQSQFSGICGLKG